MKRKLFIYGLCFTLSMIVLTESCYAAVKRGVYYTRVNIWYNHPSKILSTNYVQGNILPAGTKVRIVGVNAARVRFVDEATGQQYYITHMPKHSRLTFAEYLPRYFSTENVHANRTFTDDELKNIKQGTIEVGMRRKAVLAAYGYPPSHKTTDLFGEIWIYWMGRSQTKTIIFSDDMVSAIQ